MKPLAFLMGIGMSAFAALVMLPAVLATIGS